MVSKWHIEGLSKKERGIPVNKRMLALAVSSTLLLNSFQMALAAGAQSSAQQMQQDANEAMAMTKNIDLQKALKEINDLSTALKSIDDSSDKDTFLSVANKLQLLLIGFSTYTMHAHISKAEASKIKLGASAAAMILNKVIEIYKKNHSLDANDISAQITATIKDISSTNSEALPQELREVKMQLAKVNDQVLANQSQIQGIVENLGGTSNFALIATVGYFALHLVYPKAAKEADEALKDVSYFQQIIQKSKVVSKAPIAAYGTAGAAGLPDVLSMAIGMSSKQTKSLIEQTLTNLDIASDNIKAVANKR